MKTLLLGTLVTSITANLFAQGTVKLGNVGTGTAVSNILTGLPLSGTAFKAALYYAPDGVTDEASFIVLNPPTVSFLSSGMFAAGTRSTPATTPPAGIAVFQFRAWEVAFGTSYEEAFMNTNTLGGRFALTGKSDMVRVRTGNGSTIAPGGLVASPVPGFGGVRGFYVTTNNHGPLVLLLQPRGDANVTAGDPILLSVTAEGVPPLRYQWRFNGTELLGATNASYFLSNVQQPQLGAYDVVVSDNFSSLTSRVATLTFTYVTLVVNIDGHGAVTRAPPQMTFLRNATVTLTAIADPGSAFFSWMGSATGNVNPLTLTMDTDKTVTANFVSTALELTVEGLGSITKTPDKPFYELGEQVMLTAVPVPLYYFRRWSDGVTYNPRMITIGLHNTYTATMLLIPPLQASTLGGGTVTVTPPDGPNVSNTTVTVFATPASGWKFLQWLGDATDTNPTQSLSMTRDKCVQAIFGTALNLMESEGGALLVDPAAEHYPYGSQVRLIAVPRSGYYFVQWEGAASGTNSLLDFVVTNAQPVVSGRFAQLGVAQSALGIVPLGRGRVTTTPGANRYDSGSTVTLNAIPEPGEIFLGWNGDAGGTGPSVEVTLEQTRWISASFTRRPRLAISECPGPVNDGALRLLLTGDAGRFSLEASSDLANWTPLATLTNLFGTVQFDDPLTADNPQRFYRVSSAP